MRSCQLFSLAVVALMTLGAAGCAGPQAVKATGLSGANSPIAQAMQQTSDAGFMKQAR